MKKEEKIKERIREKSEMIAFLNTKSPKKHYHRVQKLRDEVEDLKSKLDS